MIGQVTTADADIVTGGTQRNSILAMSNAVDGKYSLRSERGSVWGFCISIVVPSSLRFVRVVETVVLILDTSIYLLETDNTARHLARPDRERQWHLSQQY